MDSLSPSWSGLRRDLLLNIANRLDSRIDRLCFRAVCYSWRSVLRSPFAVPDARFSYLSTTQASLPSPYLNPTLHGYFSLVHSTLYCLQPLKKISDTWKTPKCWPIKIQETNQPGKVRLTDPLSCFGSKNLSPPLPKGLNLLDYRVSEITKVYDLLFVGNIKISQLAYPESLSIHTDFHLSIWRKGDKNWARISSGRDGTCYSDLVYLNGKFYAVDNSVCTFSVDLSLKIALVTPSLPPSGCNRDAGLTKRLLSYLGDLFLLDRHLDPERGSLSGCNSDSNEDSPPVHFHVYKLDEEIREWVPVKSLGNRAIFVGDDCTFCVSAQEFRGCKKNCIYYKQVCILHCLLFSLVKIIVIAASKMLHCLIWRIVLLRCSQESLVVMTPTDARR